MFEKKLEAVPCPDPLHPHSCGMGSQQWVPARLGGNARRKGCSSIQATVWEWVCDGVRIYCRRHNWRRSVKWKNKKC